MAAVPPPGGAPGGADPFNNGLFQEAQEDARPDFGQMPAEPRNIGDVPTAQGIGDVERLVASSEEPTPQELVQFIRTCLNAYEGMLRDVEEGRSTLEQVSIEEISRSIQTLGELAEQIRQEDEQQAGE